jgi:hypothetical protein
MKKWIDDYHLKFREWKYSRDQKEKIRKLSEGGANCRGCTDETSLKSLETMILRVFAVSDGGIAEGR